MFSKKKRTISGKVLKERAYEIAINNKYDGYQRGLASMVYKFCLQQNRVESKRKCKRGAIPRITWNRD